MYKHINEANQQANRHLWVICNLERANSKVGTQSYMCRDINEANQQVICIQWLYGIWKEQGQPCLEIPYTASQNHLYMWLTVNLSQVRTHTQAYTCSELIMKHKISCNQIYRSIHVSIYEMEPNRGGSQIKTEESKINITTRPERSSDHIILRDLYLVFLPHS